MKRIVWCSTERQGENFYNREKYFPIRFFGSTNCNIFLGGQTKKKPEATSTLFKNIQSIFLRRTNTLFLLFSPTPFTYQAKVRTDQKYVIGIGERVLYLNF